MQQLTIGRRFALALMAAVTLGFCVAIIKGQDDGLRDAVGNLSGPWLLVAFWCGSLSRGHKSGAVLGTVATGLALAGFCFGLALISNYGTSSAVAAVHLAFRANIWYFEAGIISGPILGTLGSMARCRAASRLLLTGVVLLAEPTATVLARWSGEFSSLIGFWSASRTTAYLIEGIVGAVVILVTLAPRNRPGPLSRLG